MTITLRYFLCTKQFSKKILFENDICKTTKKIVNPQTLLWEKYLDSLFKKKGVGYDWILDPTFHGGDCQTFFLY